MAGNHTLRVLLVDDSEPLQRLMKAQLKTEGAEVVMAFDGRQGVTAALEQMKTGQNFDLIFMDMQMPEINGYKATRMLRENGYKGPIVALTGDKMLGDRERCLEAGCTDYAAKPIGKPELLAILARYTHG